MIDRRDQFLDVFFALPAADDLAVTFGREHVHVEREAVVRSDHA